MRRSTIVLGKYAATWIAIGVGMGYALLVTAVLPFAKVAVSEVLSLKTVMVSVFLISLVFSVILPFTLRFGLTGVIILLVGTQVLGIVMLILTRFARAANNPLRILIPAVEKGLRTLLGHEPTAGFLLALLAAILAINAVSMLAGSALYARRDL